MILKIKSLFRFNIKKGNLLFTAKMYLATANIARTQHYINQWIKMPKQNKTRYKNTYCDKEL